MSKVPIICICNDKYVQKLRSLRNHVSHTSDCAGTALSPYCLRKASTWVGAGSALKHASKWVHGAFYPSWMRMHGWQGLCCTYDHVQPLMQSCHARLPVLRIHIL